MNKRQSTTHPVTGTPHQLSFDPKGVDNPVRPVKDASIHFTGSEMHGLNIDCPSCGGAIWVNFNWPGLPKWTMHGNELSEPYRCPWCLGIGQFREDYTILVQSGTRLTQVSSTDLIVTDESSLAMNLLKVLYQEAAIKEDGSVLLNRVFKNTDEWKQWCAGVVNRLTSDRKLIRLPALQV